MPALPTDLAPAVNHVFVDFENVHEIDPAIIGRKTVSFTLLVGPRQKIDGSLVEKLFEHAASVQLVRLASAGKNALDFILAYYVGRAVVTDPTGWFHIVSKDTGFDPLIEHLRSKRIDARRHDSFDALTFAVTRKAPAPAKPLATPKPKSPPKPKAQPPILDERATRVQDHLRKSPRTRPKTKKRLLSYVLQHLRPNGNEGEASEVVEALGQAGFLKIDEKERVTYFLE